MSEPTAASPVDPSTRAHHPYGMSKLAAFEACPAFTSTDGSSEAAEEGTDLHSRMDRAIREFVAQRGKGAWATLADAVRALNEHEVDDEQLYLLVYCAKAVDKYLDGAPRVEVELKVQTLDYDAVTEVNYGSLDLLVWRSSEAAVIVDWKFGFLPVADAKDNLQGLGYALGVLQKYAELKRVGVMFVQPRLHRVTKVLIERANLYALLERVKSVVRLAETAHNPLTNPLWVNDLRRLNPYCSYCAAAGTCPTVLEQTQRAVVKASPVPLPDTFDPSRIHDPAQVAVMRFWVDVMELPVAQIKAHALAVAEQNGGRIEATLPDGRIVAYRVQEKKHDRVLASAPEVAEALKDVLTPQELLAAAELSIGKLEDIAVPALQELRKMTEGGKVTKKRCKEELLSLLEASGMISRPDGAVKFLKAEPVAKQIKR